MTDPADPSSLASGTAPRAPRRLDGRRILVVGAGQRVVDAASDPVGNGRAISIVCAREGAALALADRERASAEETARLVAAEGAAAHVVEADVADPAAVERMVAEAGAAMGSLDGLVLNVGIGGPLGLERTDAETWDAVFAVNARSHMLACRAALPRMGEGGAIVFVSSIAGLKPGSRIVAYDASKAALAGLMRAVALEAARKGVRANVVAPGLIDTPLGRLAGADRPSRGRTPVPLGRQGTAFEVAHVVAFLLSREASYVTGQILAVDGGLSTLL